MGFWLVAMALVLFCLAICKVSRSGLALQFEIEAETFEATPHPYLPWIGEVKMADEEDRQG